MYFMYATVERGVDPQSLFDALGDPTRRRLFERLVPQEMTVGALATDGRVSQPAASHHLRILREAGLVRERRDGRRRWYRANAEGVAILARYLDQLREAIVATQALPPAGG